MVCLCTGGEIVRDDPPAAYAVDADVPDTDLDPD